MSDEYHELLVRLCDLKTELRKKIILEDRLLKIREAAIKLRDVVGDGDNGPLPVFSDAWYELETRLNEYRNEAELIEKEKGGKPKDKRSIL